MITDQQPIGDSDLRRLVELARKAERMSLNAGACGTAWDRKKHERAEDELADELDRLLPLANPAA